MRQTQSGSYEVYPSGLVLLTEIPLWVRKIQRCHFKEGVITMDYKPSNSTELISYRPNTDWTGVLVPEMEEFSLGFQK
jgi:hypothetical protein